MVLLGIVSSQFDDEGKLEQKTDPNWLEQAKNDLVSDKLSMLEFEQLVEKGLKGQLVTTAKETADLIVKTPRAEKQRPTGGYAESYLLPYRNEVCHLCSKPKVYIQDPNKLPDLLFTSGCSNCHGKGYVTKARTREEYAAMVEGYEIGSKKYQSSTAFVQPKQERGISNG